MSSTLSRRPSLPQLSPRWTGADGPAAQGDRAQGLQAATERVDPAVAIDRFSRRLVAEGAGDLLRLYADCARLLEEQGQRRQRLRQEHDKELVGQGAANQRQHDDQTSALKRELGPEAPAYRRLASRAEDAQKSLRAIRGDVNARPLRTQFVLLYPVLMLLLGLAEIPVNRPAFELAFREEPVLSLLVAGGIGLAIIGLAHVIGVMLRQWPIRPTLRQVAARVAGLVVVLLTVGTVIYFMARLRQAYLRLVSAESEGFAQRLQEALRGNAREVVALISDQPFGINDLAFLAINLLLFLFGIVLAFLRHDPHPDYERAGREAERSERAFAKTERRYGAKLAAETARFEDRKRSLDGQIGELQASMAALADQSQGVREHCDSARAIVAQAIRKRSGTFLDGLGGTATAVTPPTLATILEELPQASFADAP